MQTTVTARIVGITRLRSSSMGNPNYSLTLDTGAVIRTSSNSSIAYAINNPEYTGSPRWNIEPPLLTLTLDKRGHVTHAVPVGPTTAMLSDDIIEIGTKVVDPITGQVYWLATNDNAEEAQWVDQYGERFTLFGVTVNIL